MRRDVAARFLIGNRARCRWSGPVGGRVKMRPRALLRHMQTQAIAKRDPSGAFDSGRHPAPALGGAAKRLAVAGMVLVDFLGRQLAGQVQHIHHKTGSVFDL